MKIDRLHELAKPERDFVGIRDYKFDRERLERLDKLRQLLIHGDDFGEEVKNVESEIEFLIKTANYLLTLVNMRYGLQLNPGVLVGISTSHTKTT